MNHSQRLIRGCRVVSPQGMEDADILIQGEWIVAVAPGLAANGVEVLDAASLYALPGAVDAHVHLRDPGATHKEDFTSGTRAALAGGVTTVLDMPNTPVPTISAAAYAEKLALARSRACCDFGLFVGATLDNAAAAASIAEAVGLKLYMGSSTGDLLVADLGHQYCHFVGYPAERPIAIHGEDEQAVQLFREIERRPPICAELAVARAITLSRATERRLHICHVTTRAELALIALAKQQGLAVTAEVTPHHLFLSKADEHELGSLGMMNPPLRQQEDVDALWQGLTTIDIVASDHAPHTLEEKHSLNPPAGVPGVETLLPLLLDAALAGRLSLSQVVQLVAFAPATIFHLPHKGLIAPGYHADIVLFDPNDTTLVGERLYSKCQWTPFAGRRLQGRIRQVLLRGRDAFAKDEVLAEPGWGRFIAPSYS
ncbi:MAG: dihydroorotase [Anaerolineae bacterium]